MLNIIYSTSALCLLAAPVVAQTELKVAALAPPGTPWIDHLNAWKANIEDISDGELTLNIYPGGQLGNEIDTFRQAQRGRIDIVAVGGGALTNQVKETNLMSTPFLFDRIETIDCIYDGSFGDKLAELFHEKGVVLLEWGEVGWFNVFANNDLSEVASVDGYMARIGQNDASRLLWQSLQADGIELPYLEISTALQTGMVDAGEATGITYVAFGFNKQAPHYVLTRHLHQAGAILIGERSLNKLSPDHQQMLRDSLSDLPDMRAAVRAVDAHLIDQHAESGGFVHELTASQRETWKAQVEPSWPEFVSGLGGQAEDLWPQLLSAKSACED